MVLDALPEAVLPFGDDIVVAGTLWQSGRRATAWCEGTFVDRRTRAGALVWRQEVPVCTYTPASLAKLGDKVVLLRDVDRATAWQGAEVGGDHRSVVALSFAPDGTPGWARDLGPGLFGKFVPVFGDVYVRLDAEGVGACAPDVKPGLAVCALAPDGSVRRVGAAGDSLGMPVVGWGKRLVVAKPGERSEVVSLPTAPGKGPETVWSGAVPGAFPAAAGERLFLAGADRGVLSWTWLDAAGAHPIAHGPGELSLRELVGRPDGSVLLVATREPDQACVLDVRPPTVPTWRCGAPAEGVTALSADADGAVWLRVDAPTAPPGAIPLGGAGWLLRSTDPAAVIVPR